MTMWKVYVQDEQWAGRMALHLVRTRPDGYDYVNPLTFTHISDGDSFEGQKPAVQSAPFTRDEVRDFLQAMSDAAWELGIKPKQIEDHSNELTATKFHLEDMRTLALRPAPGL